ncbi:hypothetical protein KPL71_019476 [Citrus sinensis]|uniref:Uncharacterized protein n=1 Tax=Citrus sinensis TaxID=2711 RepID=A0ACB8IYM2_CITSI|nr:hypothetical protein KPL71_019476 [Citrus sinensis]
MLSDADVDNKIPTQGLRYADASDSEYYILLTKDKKPICRTRCLNPPEHLPHHWNVNDIVPTSKIILDGMSHCFLSPAPECSRDHNEWRRFLIYLQGRDMVAIAKFKFWEFYILPPDQNSNFTNIRVAYKMEKTRNASNGRGHGESGRSCQVVRPTATKANINDSPTLPVNIVKETVSRENACIQARVSDTSEDNFSPVLKFSPVVGDRLSSESTIETCSRPEPRAVKQAGPLEKNFVRADPSYLQTLGQAHSGWIFGAIAELVDNSRDAKATKLEISIESIYFKKAGKDIPMLSIIDDGHGMTHQDVVRMTYFGHKQPDADDPNRIGRFGVGFKTGAMRLGKDALVLTQTADSRSIAFLSQSLNQGKDNLEIPIVSYYRKGQFMELDTVVQSEATAKYNLKSIKEFSPFNKYLIGEKAALFTKVTYSSVLGGLDLVLVPLDYSLRSYLEVIFLVPRMKIYVQGSLVRSRPLAKSLNKTCVETGIIMGKSAHLTLGRCQLEWEQMNCGIFLYWHGRLIEAYKRVGGMIHNGDTGRGVIGVIDDEGNGLVWVHNNKQGFLDCEPYARLEEWLGKVADEYWDNKFDSLNVNVILLVKNEIFCAADWAFISTAVKDGALYKPDQEWVQCNKCRKWRMLDPGFDTKSLPVEWFCYMKPFEGLCDLPEQKVDAGVVTVSAKRTGYDSRENSLPFEGIATIKVEDMSSDSIGLSRMAEDSSPLKRIRRGLPRACKKV